KEICIPTLLTHDRRRQGCEREKYDEEKSRAHCWSSLEARPILSSLSATSRPRVCVSRVVVVAYTLATAEEERSEAHAEDTNLRRDSRVGARVPFSCECSGQGSRCDRRARRRCRDQRHQLLQRNSLCRSTGWCAAMEGAAARQAVDGCEAGLGLRARVHA